MTEHYGERVDDTLEAGWGLKHSERRSQDGGNSSTTWGRYHQGKRRNANRGVEREHEAKGNVWRRISTPQ